MTKAELKQFIELYNKFEEDVSRVTRILSKEDKYRHNFMNIDNFWIEIGYDNTPDMVNTRGRDQYDSYFGEFNADMLTWTNNELESYVNKLLQEQEKQKEEREKRIRTQQEAKEREEYERLKQKYG